MAASPAVQRTVVADACVLINFLNLDRLSIPLNLPGYEFVVATDARAEIAGPLQKARLDSAIGSGQIREVPLDDLPELAVYAELRGFLDPGESTTLAIAASRGWLVATDEKRAGSEVVRRLGKGRLLNTAGIFIEAIRVGMLSVAEADRLKLALEPFRFKMPLASFQDVLT